MPELPEVETVRRGLAQRLVGRSVEHVEVGRERVVRRTSREALIDGLTNTTILRAERRGKYLLMPLNSGNVMMIHLRMSGQVLVAGKGAERPVHTHVVLSLDNDTEMWFVDPRTFGEVVVYDPANAAIELPPIARLGVDPIAEDFPRSHLRQLVRSTNQKLKPFLLDQTKVAGIGNIYADEILHRARLRPDRSAKTIDAAATWRLHDAIRNILNDSIKVGGSTLGDAQYVDVDGEVGSFQDEHRVYGRAGQRCSTCARGWIRRTIAGGRSTHHCPVCQH